ncbi:meiotically up-regulated protein, putative [Ichthyophthirius multifiliis]|uniref:Meiotically up-regulated protein, putative n=1 Tax=Ichthyophthirius multifiliis TaxID=5932 RepID=G0R0D1_ICHMU|nr:meiotically up-regulated protein, putative [Ichthyophthirius multifiliis]EGR29068.1 meiotically up-regulated protein, putative [Ichthyophthirius multifiliis]|eukprot:XP_004030304.1 meiotically up-regulated protein, putative [Ichthyophthirius multifiliis]
MFYQNYPNTLDTTIYYFGYNNISNIPDTFIITGDIEAMWQRDSTNQVIPYIRYIKEDKKLLDLILGLINRQINNVLIDPYANAFNFKPTGSPWDSDKSTKLDSQGRQINAMIPELWERKFEIDSLASVLRLQNEFFEQTQGNDSFMTQDYFRALQLIYDVLKDQQKGTFQEDQQGKVHYTFQRFANNPTDSTQHGRGNPSFSDKSGMVKTAFRPSDDACIYAFNIPGNAMLSVQLLKTADSIKEKNATLSQKYEQLSKDIKTDIYLRGITKDNQGNDIFAYEIDGFGNVLKMDDANLPSLLSLTYLGFISQNDTLYINTRKMILDSSQNPYFFKGKQGEGIGGPHIGFQYAWPLSIITRAITSQNDQEILYCLEMLKNTTDDTLFMHESFNVNNSTDYTRTWFAWANSFFGELILHLIDVKPYLVI